MDKSQKDKLLSEIYDIAEKISIIERLVYSPESVSQSDIAKLDSLKTLQTSGNIQDHSSELIAKGDSTRISNQEEKVDEKKPQEKKQTDTKGDLLAKGNEVANKVETKVEAIAPKAIEKTENLPKTAFSNENTESRVEKKSEENSEIGNEKAVQPSKSILSGDSKVETIEAPKGDPTALDLDQSESENTSSNIKKSQPNNINASQKNSESNEIRFARKTSGGNNIAPLLSALKRKTDLLFSINYDESKSDMESFANAVMEADEILEQLKSAANSFKKAGKTMFDIEDLESDNKDTKNSNKEILNNLNKIFKGQLSQIKMALFSFDSKAFKKMMDEIVENMNPFSDESLKKSFDSRVSKLLTSLDSECDYLAYDDMKELFTIIFETLAADSSSDETKKSATALMEISYRQFVSDFSLNEWKGALEKCGEAKKID